MDNQKRNELVQKIEKAFAKSPRPNNKKTGDSSELDLIIGKKRKDVTIDNLLKTRHLIFFSKKALRYYLPVYLIAAVLRSDELLEIIDDVIGFLASQSDLSLKDYFSKEEANAIFSFLEAFCELFPDGNWKYIETEYDKLKRALDYWK